MLGLHEAPTGRKLYRTARRRYAKGEPGPRVARRFVPPTSVAIVVDWGIGDGPQRTLALALSLRRSAPDLTVPTCAASLGTQRGRTPDTIRVHLRELSERGYVEKLPLRFGWFRLRFTPKALRFVQESPADKTVPPQMDKAQTAEQIRPINEQDLSNPLRSSSTPAVEKSAQEQAPDAQPSPVPPTNSILEATIADAYRRIAEGRRRRGLH
jgi:hypothetical protein